MKTLYWLSFADSEEQFLGAALVEVDDNPDVPDEPVMVRACRAALRLGCNPGGEVMGHPISAGYAARIPDRYRARLLTRDECAALARAFRGFGS